MWESDLRVLDHAWYRWRLQFVEHRRCYSSSCSSTASSAAQSDFEESAQAGSRHTEEPARRWHPGRITTGQLSVMRNDAAAATEEIGAARSDEEEDLGGSDT